MPATPANCTAYRVGGYVRDRLLGLDPRDCDWVVVGCTPEAGYRAP